MSLLAVKSYWLKIFRMASVWTSIQPKNRTVLLPVQSSWIWGRAGQMSGGFGVQWYTLFIRLVVNQQGPAGAPSVPLPEVRARKTTRAGGRYTERTHLKSESTQREWRIWSRRKPKARTHKTRHVKKGTVGTIKNYVYDEIVKSCSSQCKLSHKSGGSILHYWNGAPLHCSSTAAHIKVLFRRIKSFDSFKFKIMAD